MKEYVLSVAGMAILTVIVSILTSKKKYAQTVNGVLKLCLLLVLVAPILTILRHDTTTFLQTEGIFGQDTAYINNSYALALDKQIEKQFNVIVDVKCTIAVEDKNQKGDIRIIVRDFGMNEKDEHINIMSKIKTTAEKLCAWANVEVVNEVP